MLAADEKKTSSMLMSGGEPYYVIALSTWITDRKAAFDLAVQISASLAANDLVDEFGTTLGIEDDNVNGQERIYERMEFPIVTP
jgi:hypothetical protein